MTEPTEPTCGHCRWLRPRCVDYRVFTPIWCANDESDNAYKDVNFIDTCDHHEPAETQQ